MVGQEVQCIEVEVLGLDLGSFGDLPAHPDEHVGNLIGDHRDRVPRSRRTTRTGQGDIDGLGDQDGRVAFGGQHRQSFLVGALDLAAGDVDSFARFGLLLFGQRAELAAGQSDRRLVPHVFGLGDRERGQVDRVGERCHSGVHCGRE